MAYHLLKQRRIVDEDGEDLPAQEFICGNDRVCDLPWRMGIRFKRPPEGVIELEFEDDGYEEEAFRDYLSTPMPLASSRLKAALLAAGAANVEFYNTRVRGSERFTSFPGYFAVNIVGIVEVADDAKTSSQRAFGRKGADLIDRLVPRATLALNLPIFRMAEQVSTLIVSDAVKVACEAAGVETLEFAPLIATELS